jgi:exosome complex RNA-binding protein Rrp4
MAGVVERVGRLLTVRPMNSRYHGEVGDVVIGRVRAIRNKRWLMDIQSTHDAVMMLSSVNLESGEQRRRTNEDMLSMRQVYAEGDLVSAEIHSIFNDGSYLLHARSSKYGKLVEGKDGTLQIVPSSLMKRMKQHFVTLSVPISPSLEFSTEENIPISVLFGVNGALFISKPSLQEGETGANNRIVISYQLVLVAISMLKSMSTLISPDTILDVIKEILKGVPKEKLTTEVLSMFASSKSWRVEFTRTCREKIENSLLEFAQEIDAFHGEHAMDEDGELVDLGEGEEEEDEEEDEDEDEDYEMDEDSENENTSD